jgi:hypothetical protein
MTSAYYGGTNPADSKTRPRGIGSEEHAERNADGAGCPARANDRASAPSPDAPSGLDPGPSYVMSDHRPLSSSPAMIATGADLATATANLPRLSQIKVEAGRDGDA